MDDPATATRLRARLKTSWTSPAGAWVGALAGVALAVLSGCSPKIGDHCILNTDCGSSGSLVCDTSPPNGYCTQFNCTANACQNSAACVEFEPAVPGCPYDDYHAPSRTGRTFCMAACHSNSDCRQSEGYICADPRQPPWSAAIIDDNQSQQVCIAAFSSSSVRLPSEGGLPEGSVCSASGPVFDASLAFAEPDAPGEGSTDAVADVALDGAEVADAGADAPREGSPDGSGDASPEAAEGGDGAADAPADGATDVGAADAPDGD